MLDFVRQALPAAGHVFLVGFLEALGRGDVAVVEMAAFLVARQVQGGQHLFTEGGGTFQDGFDHVGGGFAAVGQAGVVAGVVEHVVQQEAHVAQGRLVLRHRKSPLSKPREQRPGHGSGSGFFERSFFSNGRSN